MIVAQYPCIHIETCAYCNAHCTFCSYANMSRKPGVMSNQLFDKIISELSYWPMGCPIEIVPVHYGEFFINPNWLSILQRIERHLPHTRIAIPTNGSLVDNDTVDKLVKISNLKYVGFSLYTCDPEKYEKLIGLPSKTIDKIENAAVRKRKLRPDIEVGIGTTNNESYVSAEEINQLRSRFGNIVTPHDMTNFSRNETTKNRLPCQSIFLSMVVLYDGRVCLCCYDSNGEIIIGDANESSMIDIWNSDVARAYRVLHASGERDQIHMCRKCTFEYKPEQSSRIK